LATERAGEIRHLSGLGVPRDVAAAVRESPAAQLFRCARADRCGTEQGL